MITGTCVKLGRILKRFTEQKVNKLMRHEKSALLIELARELAASRMGLTLDEMAQRIGVKRRTIERMRDRLLEMFDTMIEISDPPTKRWRIEGKLDGFMQTPSLKEMAALKTAQNHLEIQNSDAAIALKGLENKMMAVIGPKLTRMEPDLEALMQAEAIAINPGPRPKNDNAVLNILRDAILMMNQVSFIYDGGTNIGKTRKVIPYGILFGGEAYLVAVEDKTKPTLRPRMWRIDKIRDIQLLDDIGAAPEDFSLAEFAQRSFGVFQEDEMYDVEIRIFAAAAPEAKRWRFHPSQSFETLENGDLILRMRGGGLKELAWSLFRWGGKMEILGPKALKDEMAIALEMAKEIV